MIGLSSIASEQITSGWKTKAAVIQPLTSLLGKGCTRRGDDESPKREEGRTAAMVPSLPWAFVEGQQAHDAMSGTQRRVQ